MIGLESSCRPLNQSKANSYPLRLDTCVFPRFKRSKCIEFSLAVRLTKVHLLPHTILNHHKCYPVLVGNFESAFLFFARVDDLIGRVTFDRETLAQSSKGLDKWFPVSLADMHNYSDIQGDIRIETTLFEKVKKVRTARLNFTST